MRYVSSKIKKEKRNKQGEKEKKCTEGRKDGMSITEKETGNLNKRERDREERKGEDK